MIRTLKDERMTAATFHAHHFNPPAGPVLLSVPHAGRAYDDDVIAQLRVPFDAIMPLEDRHADQLTEAALAAGVPTIIALTPRLKIDLNRAPDDLDPESVIGGFGRGAPASAKARAGLGLVPTRLWGVGPLWRKAMESTDLACRIRDIHAPYHGALSTALESARQKYGNAILIDLHSMPPIPGGDAPDIVIGDRFGASAAAEITATAEAILKGLGFRVAINTPYAGGYVITRHAAVSRGVHALQIEVDRRLYLDAALDQPSPGLARIQRAIAMLIDSLGAELRSRFAAAAE
jgi:N-formylglutamate amidohydrolase